MRRSAILVLSCVAALAACRKQAPETTAPTRIASEEIVDDTKKVAVEIGYRAAPEREVELLVNLQAIGIEEMDKLVVDITVDGFVLVGGEPEWSGFVAPRFPIKHKASFRLLDGAESGTLTVSVARSVNSEVLLTREVPFVADGDRVRADDGA